MPQPVTLREHIRLERIAKEKRYEEYESLLASAIAAASAAAAQPGPFSEGKVWLALDDGCSSFARFLKSEHPGMFMFVSRYVGCACLVEGDFREAVAYAMAFRDVLSGGGIGVTVVSVPIEDAALQ